MLWIITFLICGIFQCVSSIGDYEPSNYGYGDYDYPDSTGCVMLDDPTKKFGSIRYYSNKSYTDRCWLLHPKSQAYITIKFVYIFIPKGFGGCYSSNEITLQPYRGNYPEYSTMRRYCGTNVTSTITFQTTQLKVDFRASRNSDYPKTFQKNIGFELQYKIDSPNHDLVLQSYVFITSFGYPKAATSNSKSSWNISLPSSSPFGLIQLIMNTWKVPSRFVLYIYDGPYKSSPLLAQLSNFNNNKPKPAISSTGPHMYIELQVGNAEGNYIYNGFNATIKLKGVCLPGTSPCGDGEHCFNEDQRCDQKRDCVATGIDERNCGKCRPGEFWCGGEIGSCYAQAQLCDGRADCITTRADERYCSECASNAFLCKMSNKCIDKSWRCDGQSDCLDNEDELGCISPHHDVLVHSYHFITSPGYPQPPEDNSVSSWNVSLVPDGSSLPLQLKMNMWKVDASTSLRIYDGPSTSSPLLYVMYSDQTDSLITGSGPHMYIELHAGNFRYTGSVFTGFNATVKIKGYCLPGSSSCGDGVNCFDNTRKCDRNRDCYDTGLDEKGCGGCAEDKIWCGSDHFVCYSPEQRCNGKHDCATSKADEVNCASCAPGAFLCKTSDRCIYERWRCDGQSDCPHNEDEENCTYPASRRVITAAIVGSLVCGLLLAVALGCTCKLYTLRNAAHARNRRNRFLQTTPLGRIARELLQREAPPSYSMTVDGVEHSSDHSRRHSSSSRRRRERQRRRRNREPRIRRAQAAPSPHVETSGNQESNREDVASPPDSIPSSSRHVSSTSVTEIESTPASPAPTSANTSNAVEVVCVLAEMGLAEYPHESNPEESQQRDSSAAPPPNEAAGSSQASSEPQAPPLPKKNQIRPVLVEAPFNSVLVDDIPSCVYPNPPSYHEATISEAPPSPTLLQENKQEDDNPAKPDSSSRNILNKFWTKHSPNKMKFLKFPSLQGIFNIGQTNGGFEELRDTAGNVHLNDDQVQLISDFVSDEIDPSDDVSLLDLNPSENEHSYSNPTLNSDGSSVFELLSYNAPGPVDTTPQENESSANLESIPFGVAVNTNSVDGAELPTSDTLAKVV